MGKILRRNFHRLAMDVCRYLYRRHKARLACM
jgi:hypothetical protein